MKLILTDGTEYDITNIDSESLEPGDIIIFRTKESIPLDAIDKIINSAKQIFPNNKCILLEDGIDIEILRVRKEANG